MDLAIRSKGSMFLAGALERISGVSADGARRKLCVLADFSRSLLVFQQISGRRGVCKLY